MPKIIVDKPFHFREGPKTTAYEAGKEEQEVSDACAKHAVEVVKAAHYPKPKAEPKPPAAAPAE